MLKHFRLILPLAIAVACYSCHKDSDTATVPGMPVYPIISGFTGFDVVGNIIGPLDTTDWNLNDNWSQVEKDLFGNTSFNTNCTFNDTLLFVRAFPIPMGAQLHAPYYVPSFS